MYKDNVYSTIRLIDDVMIDKINHLSTSILCILSISGNFFQRCIILDVICFSLYFCYFLCCPVLFGERNRPMGMFLVCDITASRLKLYSFATSGKFSIYWSMDVSFLFFITSTSDATTERGIQGLVDNHTKAHRTFFLYIHHCI